MKCTHCDHCELFPQFALNPALQVWQTHYCHGDYERCIRFQMSCRNETVPLNLLPNGTKVELPRTSADYGATALFNAILKSRAHMIDSLFKHGVDVNVQNSDGMTPLMAAASTGNLEIMQLLLAKGATIDIANNFGENARGIAIRYGHPEAADLLQATEKNTVRAKVAPIPKRKRSWFKRLWHSR